MLDTFLAGDGAHALKLIQNSKLPEAVKEAVVAEIDQAHDKPFAIYVAHAGATARTGGYFVSVQLDHAKVVGATAPDAQAKLEV